MTREILGLGNLADAVVVFRIGEELAALARPDVLEILPRPRLWTPPSMPPVLAGVLRLGREPVPVVSLDVLFSAGPAPADLYSHILLVYAGDGARLGLLVTRVLDVISLSPNPLAPTASQTLGDCVTAQLAMPGGEAVHLLALERLLLREEATRLSALREMARARVVSWGVDGSE